MEFIKPKEDIIIIENYIPDTNQPYIDYFNRALVFAQTNYHLQLMKLMKISFIKLVPTIFFEEYIGVILRDDDSKFLEEQTFLTLIKSFNDFYPSFYHPSFPSKEELLSSNLIDHKSFDDIYLCASILHRGIKLFNWTEYKRHYLSSVEKLMILPGLNTDKAKKLARNIGLTTQDISNGEINKLASHWKFDTATDLCLAIQKHVPMQLKVIESILWYSTHHFDA